MIGFIESFDELQDILSTQNGRVMFTIQLASCAALVFIAIALYVFLWAITPTIYGGF